jgi:hypothetical protein
VGEDLESMLVRYFEGSDLVKSKKLKGNYRDLKDFVMTMMIAVNSVNFVYGI